jgi:hypothetical protein
MDSEYLHLTHVEHNLKNNKKDGCTNIYSKDKPSVTVVLVIRPAVVLKICILWNITPFSSLKVNRRFGGACRFHLECRKISQARNQRKELRSVVATFSRFVPTLIIFLPRRW